MQTPNPPEESLDTSIDIHLKSCDVKKQILDGLWHTRIDMDRWGRSKFDLDPYFAYYTSSCTLTLRALHRHGYESPVKTHRDIIEIANHVQEPKERSAIKDILRAKSSAIGNKVEEALDWSLNLVAQLLLMADFKTSSNSFSISGQLKWTDGLLSDCVDKYFNEPRVLGTEKVKLEKDFTVRNLDRIAGIEISWTTNILEHLQLWDNEQKVSIFHYATMLECQTKSPLYPTAFVDETLSTIALLFPSTDGDTRKWFSKMSAKKPKDQRAIEGRRIRTADRQIENFEFWHDRLVILKQRFDEAEPGTIQQWWCDRRKRVQWYTFWLAALVLALTVFFGVVQSVEGAMQIYKAFNS